MSQLHRRLGVLASMGIGIAAMLGAGVFFVWTPAFERAGSWTFVALGLAAVVATLNALVTSQLAMHHPVSGGIYSYARTLRGRYLGFLAGWLFLTGKIGSAAAIAYVAASYVLPAFAKLLAIIFVLVCSALIIRGIRVAARVSMVIAALVAGGLLWLTLPQIYWASSWQLDFDTSVMGVLGAAGLFFFAFAGYARMATLGEEAINPVKTIPRAIIGALVIVLGLYFLVALAVIPRFAQGGPREGAPLLVLAEGAGEEMLVGVVAVVASVGSLLAILAGLSRTSLAMARHRDLPTVLSVVSERTKGPIVSELVIAVLACGLILATNPVWLVGLSSAGVLAYYSIGHLSALVQPASERFVPRFFTWLGLVLCLALVVSVPSASLVTAVISAALGTLWFLWTHRASSSESSET